MDKLEARYEPPRGYRRQDGASGVAVTLNAIRTAANSLIRVADTGDAGKASGFIRQEALADRLEREVERTAALASSTSPSGGHVK